MREFLHRYRRWLLTAAGLLILYALAGFLLAPWLVERQAVKIVAGQFDSELRLERIAINPFALSLTIEGLALDDPRGENLAEIDRVYVNFQTSSLFRWAWTFDEFRMEAPELRIAREADGRFNFQRLLEARPPAAETAPPPADGGGVPRLVVHELAITGSVLHWRDAVPPQTVETRVGPVDIRVRGLNTLPERPGTQDVVIRTASEGTLRWSGSLQLNPLQLAGEAAIDGSHFELLSAYLRQETGLDITDGNVDVDFAWAVATQPDGGIGVTVDRLSLRFEGVRARTFPAAGGDESREPREWLSLPALTVRGGLFRWPERTLAVDSIDIDDAVLNLHRDDTGTLDIVRGLARRETAEPAPPVTDDAADDADDADDPGEPWRVSLGRFGIANLSASLRDESVQPTALTEIESLDIEVRSIGNEPGAAFPTTLSLRPAEGGTVALDGSIVVLPEPVLAFDVTTQALALAGAQPYIEPLADVSFDSGTLDMDARLESSPENRLRFAGDMAINDFLITETDAGTRLGSWRRLGIAGFAFSAADETLEVSEIRIEEPYADVLITEEGRVNLGRVAKGAADNGGEEPAGDGDEQPPEEESTDVEDDGLPVRVTVGRVVIEEATADFADRSLPLPFNVKISKLKGELSTIDTASDEPSRVSAEGTVDEYGYLRVTGSVTPLAPARNTDLRAEFENVAMPKFSAYSVPFAGRKIASGSLSLDLGYRLEDGRLVGRNKIVLREFELGESVPHPDAASLPLGLAIALLKDSSGTIDVDLPISGDIGSPDFSIGGVVAKAMGNLIVKIATSPFALLGKLLGVEESELERVSFLPGRSDLTPPQVQRAANLAQALTLRPQLVLVLPPVHAPEADAGALREAALEAAVETRVTGIVADDDRAMYDERVRQALETLFVEQSPAEDPRAVLDELRAEHTAPEGKDDGEPVFDGPAYARALRARLLGLQTLEEGALEALARERVRNLRQTVVGAGSGLEGRVVEGEAATVDVTENDRVPMRVKLTAGAARELE